MSKFDELYLPDAKLSGRFMKKGAGEPLVYLHGAFGARLWSPFLELLSKQYTVYAPLQPGFEDLNGLEKLDDVVDLALYYLELIDVLNLGKIQLVGHSLGGMASLETAALCSHGIERIVLISPLGLWMDAVPIKDIFIMNEEEQIEAMWHDRRHSSVEYLFPKEESEYERERRVTEQKNDFIGAAKFLWPIPDRGLSRRMYRIKVPVLLLWGESDTVVPPAYAKEFCSRLKECQSVILPEAGHLPMFEQPDVLCQRVLSYLGSP